MRRKKGNESVAYCLTLAHLAMFSGVCNTRRLDDNAKPPDSIWAEHGSVSRTETFFSKIRSGIKLRRTAATRALPCSSDKSVAIIVRVRLLELKLWTASRPRRVIAFTRGAIDPHEIHSSPSSRFDSHFLIANHQPIDCIDRVKCFRLAIALASASNQSHVFDSDNYYWKFTAAGKIVYTLRRAPARRHADSAPVIQSSSWSFSMRPMFSHRHRGYFPNIRALASHHVRDSRFDFWLSDRITPVKLNMQFSPRRCETRHHSNAKCL